MGRVTVYTLLAAAAASFTPEPAEASSMRCEDRHVRTGETLQRTRALCGEPDFADRRYERHQRSRSVLGPCPNDARRNCRITERYTEEIVIDEWTYDFGPRRLLHLLTFRNGRLESVRTDGYGVADK